MATALIIDDEEDLGLLLKEYLIKRNFQVYISQTLENACFLLEQITPSIIFIDNNLPDGSGWNNAPCIASKNPDAYIFLMSGFHLAPPQMPEHIKYNIVEKPLSYQQLNEAVSHVTR